MVTSWPFLISISASGLLMLPSEPVNVIFISQDNLTNRKVEQFMPPITIYSLTPSAEQLGPVLITVGDSMREIFPSLLLQLINK